MAPRNKPAPTQYTAPDTLSRDEIAKNYGFALKVIYANPEITQLFEKALAEGWTNAMFQARLQDTNWWQTNSEYARTAWAAEQLGGADWETQKQNARLRVQEAATQVGRTLSPEELATLERRYLYEGWGQASRSRLLMQALSEGIQAAPEGQFMRGGAGDLQEQLANEARRNGLRFSQQFYQSAARSVASGLRTADDWRRDIRQQAASKWPIFGEQIRAGVDVADLASTYVQTMAETFEIDPDSIDLNDPFIVQALAGYDDQGKPKAMGLWDFQQKLRKDPRWMNTKQATDEISSIATDVLRSFGFMK